MAKYAKINAVIFVHNALAFSQFGLPIISRHGRMVVECDDPAVVASIIDEFCDRKPLDLLIQTGTSKLSPAWNRALEGMAYDDLTQAWSFQPAAQKVLDLHVMTVKSAGDEPKFTTWQVPSDASKLQAKLATRLAKYQLVKFVLEELGDSNAKALGLRRGTDKHTGLRTARWLASKAEVQAEPAKAKGRKAKAEAQAELDAAAA